MAMPTSAEQNTARILVFLVLVFNVLRALILYVLGALIY